MVFLNISLYQFFFSKFSVSDISHLQLSRLVKASIRPKLSPDRWVIIDGWHHRRWWRHGWRREFHFRQCGLFKKFCSKISIRHAHGFFRFFFWFFRFFLFYFRFFRHRLFYCWWYHSRDFFHVRNLLINASLLTLIWVFHFKTREAIKSSRKSLLRFRKRDTNLKSPEHYSEEDLLHTPTGTYRHPNTVGQTLDWCTLHCTSLMPTHLYHCRYL